MKSPEYTQIRDRLNLLIEQLDNNNIVSSKNEAKGLIAYLEKLDNSVEFTLNDTGMLDQIFSNVPVLLFLINNSFDVVKINRSGSENIMANADGRIKPGDVMRCVHSMEHVKGCGYTENCSSCFIRNTIKESFSTRKEIYKRKGEVITKNNGILAIRDVLINAAYLKNGDNEFSLVSVDDISEIVNAQKEIEKAKNIAVRNNLLKSAFLANMSHEIRTPMNGIIGFSELLSYKELSVDQQREYIELINKSSKQLIAIIDDIIDISRIEAGVTEFRTDPFNVNFLIMDLFAFYRPNMSKKNLQLYIKKFLQDDHADYYGDEPKIRQIFNNLLNNSLKYTNKGSIEFGYTIENSHLRFYVKDTGIGIANKDLSNLFNRFNQINPDLTKRYAGTGLGLSICKAFAEGMNGDIWAESVQNVGSTFYFELPLVKVPLNKNITSLDTFQIPDFSNLTFLIAEDDEINFIYMQELLTEAGANVLFAGNGKEAVEKCIENKDISMVLMDVKMPEMNGYEATKIIKQLNSKLPVIIQTAFAMSGDKEKAIGSGCDDYIAKPIQEKQLYSIIIKNLKK